MGLFSQIFGSDRPEGLFRSEMQHLTNRVHHVSEIQEKLPKLRASGVGENQLCVLSLYFITNSKSKAKQLVAELGAVGYSSTLQAPTDKSEEWVITGTTNEIKMSEESLSEWTNLMCYLAANLDCEFTAWDLSV